MYVTDNNPDEEDNQFLSCLHTVPRGPGEDLLSLRATVHHACLGSALDVIHYILYTKETRQLLLGSVVQ